MDWNKIGVGVVIILLASLLTIFAGIPGAVEVNTAHRLKHEGKQEQIIHDLAEIKATLKFLVKEYDNK